MDPLRMLAETSGYFTRQAALDMGHDDRSIRRALKARAWRRVRPGAYTFPDLWPTTDEALHRLTAHAVARKLGPSVALSHLTGALEHGLRVWSADLSLVHVTRLDGGAGRTESGVVHHEGFSLDADVINIDGTGVMHPARVAIETASLLSTEAGLVTLDSALHLERCSREQLDATYALLQSWPGMRGAQLAVRMADGGGQSVGESRTRYLCYAHSLPAPELQWEVRDSTGRLIGITDFAWPEHRLLGEFDGKVKYGRLRLPGEEPGDAVFREKRREDSLRELTGWRVLRFTWADLYDGPGTAARIRRLLRAAA